MSHTHHTDHLAPLCSLLGAPLLIGEEQHFLTAQSHYPDVQVELVEWKTITPKLLAEHFDLLLSCDDWPRQEFKDRFQPFEQLFGKRLRNLHCPKGFSDKGFWFERCANQDATVIYGRNMIDLLKERGVWENMSDYVITGNYRHSYYIKNKEFMDSLVEKEIFSQFEKEQTTVLYAPTWEDSEKSTSLYGIADHLFSKLPSDMNLLVKLHPLLTHDEADAAKTAAVMDAAKGKPNIVVIKDYPLVYPILNRADCYLGDLSAVGYDFLAFNRPMFFLNQQKREAAKDRGLYLFRCGIEVQPEDYPRIYSIIEESIENTSLSNVREEVYAYSFDEISETDLKSAIETIVATAD